MCVCVRACVRACARVCVRECVRVCVCVCLCVLNLLVSKLEKSPCNILFRSFFLSDPYVSKLEYYDGSRTLVLQHHGINLTVTVHLSQRVSLFTAQDGSVQHSVEVVVW